MPNLILKCKTAMGQGKERDALRDKAKAVTKKNEEIIMLKVV